MGKSLVFGFIWFLWIFPLIASGDLNGPQHVTNDDLNDPQHVFNQSPEPAVVKHLVAISSPDNKVQAYPEQQMSTPYLFASRFGITYGVLAGLPWFFTKYSNVCETINTTFARIFLNEKSYLFERVKYMGIPLCVAGVCAGINYFDKSKRKYFEEHSLDLVVGSFVVYLLIHNTQSQK